VAEYRYQVLNTIKKVFEIIWILLKAIYTIISIPFQLAKAIGDIIAVLKRKTA